MPGNYYVPLPSFRPGGEIDFSQINAGLDALGRSIERNRLLSEQKQIGEALRSQQSGTQPTATSSSAPQYAPSTQPRNALLSPAAGSAAAAGRDYPLPSYASDLTMRSYADAISKNESGGNYQLVGPVTRTGDRAYGKFQVMGANIGPWTKEVFGREISPQEFLADPDAQEKLFVAKFGQYVQKTGNPQDAASMWFTGVPAAQGASRRDILGTTGQRYVDQFNAGIRGGPTPTGQEAAVGPNSRATGLNYAAGIDRALRQGNVDAAIKLASIKQEQDTLAQTSELRGIQVQQGRQELEDAAHRRLAGIAQTIEGQADPAARQAMWNKFVAVNPRIATTLQQYGIDPADHEAGSALLISEARGLTETKPAEFATFKSDEGIYQKGPGAGPSGVKVLREPGSDGKAMTNAAELRKEFNAQSKDFQTQLAGADRVNVGAKSDTPQGDIALVYGFMKMLDPTSVVREGEFATAENSGGIPQRIQVIYNKAINGERLTPEMRAGFVKQAEEQLVAARKRQDATTQRYSDIARRNKLDPKDIVTTFAAPPGSPEVPGTQQIQSVPRPQGMSDAQLVEQANQAIQSGKDPAAVRQQLEAWGVKFQ